MEPINFEPDVPTIYAYIDPDDIANAVTMSSYRVCVRSAADVLHWMNASQQTLDPSDSVTATFIVDVSGDLWIGDRHSEHVACARGASVLAVGEITFTITQHQVEVTSITNQSTGYCPRPDSWHVVAQTLEQAQLHHSNGFDLVFIFRRCCQCGQINIFIFWPAFHQK